MRTEVGEGKHVVGVEDTHHLHRVEVKAFGDHLCAHKDVGLLVLKTFQNALVVVFRTCGVEIKAGHLGLRHDEA